MIRTMRSGLKVVVRRMLLAAVGMILGGVSEGGQTAAIKPQDLALGSGMHSEQVAIVLDEPVGSAVVEVTWAMKGEQGCK